MNSLKLINYSFYHALVILLPMIFGAALAIRQNEKNTLVILAAAATCGGLFSYGIFWLFLWSPNVGISASYFGYILMLLLCVTWLRKFLITPEISVFIKPVFVWICYSVFILAISFAPSDLSDPLNFAALRFSHPLPVDNQLPLMFAEQILNGKVLIPMIGDWLSSDRPPLQTAYLLVSGINEFANRAWHYQVLATLLQCIWVVPMWLILDKLNIKKTPFALALLVPMYSGVAFVHSVFTWPKLFPVYYVLIIYGILFEVNSEAQRRFSSGALIGSLAAFAMLCHGGSIFIIIGLGLTLLLTHKMPSKLFIIASVFFGVLILATWSYYQAVLDPPGNRLIKWHLAGSIPIDSKSFTESLRYSYSGLDVIDFLKLKISNLNVVFNTPIESIQKLVNIFFKKPSQLEVFQLRENQFYAVWSGLSVFALASFLLFGCVFFAKSIEKQTGLNMIKVAAITIFVWIVMLYGPATTVIHQGSLAVMIFLFTGLVLYIYVINKYLLYLFCGVHFYIVYVIYLSSNIFDYSKNINMTFTAVIFILLSLLPFFLNSEKNRLTKLIGI